MKILALDTATETASVALWCHQTWYIREQPQVLKHAAMILPMIESVMQESKLQFSELDGIAFGQGPGSFTGLRIACAVAKGLSFAHNLPLYPVSNLQMMAHAVYHRYAVVSSKTEILSVIDARMQQVYWGLFDNYLPKTEEHVSALGDIEIVGNQPIILTKLGEGVFKDSFKPNIQSRIVDIYSMAMSARDAVSLVLNGTSKACDVKDVVPKYIRDKVV